MALLATARGRTRSFAARHQIALLAALCALLLTAIAIVLLWHAPPAVARLLPEADAVVYADLRPVRLLTRFDRHPVPHSPDYQHFIDATGILPERDLDRVALALHRMPDPAGPNGPVGYSEVLSGHLDPRRLTAWLASVATTRELYAGHEIFVVPVADPTPQGASPATPQGDSPITSQGVSPPASQGVSPPKSRGVSPPTAQPVRPPASPAVRLLRVTVLSDTLVAASNMPTAEQLHSILDHARTPALLRSGPLVLAALYPSVPVAAPAWGVGQLALPLADSGRVTLAGLRLPLLPDQPIVASLRYTTALHLRLELLAADEPAATTQAEALRGMLNLTRALTSAAPSSPTPAPLAELLASVTVEPQHDRTIVQAIIPVPLLEDLAGGQH